MVHGVLTKLLILSRYDSVIMQPHNNVYLFQNFSYMKLNHWLKTTMLSNWQPYNNQIIYKNTKLITNNVALVKKKKHKKKLSLNQQALVQR